MLALYNLLRRYRRDESGQSLVEFAFILSLVSIAAILILLAIGVEVDELLTSVVDAWPS
jgi:Flp pilus assembly pilin Flp